MAHRSRVHTARFYGDFAHAHKSAAQGPSICMYICICSVMACVVCLSFHNARRVATQYDTYAYCNSVQLLEKCHDDRKQCCTQPPLPGLHSIFVCEYVCTCPTSRSNRPLWIVGYASFDRLMQLMNCTGPIFGYDRVCAISMNKSVSPSTTNDVFVCVCVQNQLDVRE